MPEDRPSDWKNYEDFAAGIATNRLPATERLTGEQRGHGDTDMATTYKFDEDLYVFTFREFKTSVAVGLFVQHEAAALDGEIPRGHFLGRDPKQLGRCLYSKGFDDPFSR